MFNFVCVVTTTCTNGDNSEPVVYGFETIDEAREWTQNDIAVTKERLCEEEKPACENGNITEGEYTKENHDWWQLIYTVSYDGDYDVCTEWHILKLERGKI